jgi:hypothetical protein
VGNRLTLGVEAHCALLELVEGGVIGTVDADEFFFKSLQFALTLSCRCGTLNQSLELLINFLQVVLPALYILLRLQHEDLLLLIMMFYSFCQSILAVFKHLNKQL